MRLWIAFLVFAVGVMLMRCGTAEGSEFGAIGTITSTNPAKSMCMFVKDGKTTTVKIGQYFVKGTLTIVSRRYCKLGSTFYRVGTIKKDKK